MGRIKPNTSWTTRPALQSDVWYLLDDLSNIISQQLSNFGNWLQSLIIQSFASITHIIISLIIMYFILYYLYVNSDKVENGLIWLIPFNKKNSKRLINKFKNVTYSTVITSGLIAVMQGLLISIGFIMFGLRGALLWGLIGAIISFVLMMGRYEILYVKGLDLQTLGVWVGSIGTLLAILFVYVNTRNQILNQTKVSLFEKKYEVYQHIKAVEIALNQIIVAQISLFVFINMVIVHLKEIGAVEKANLSMDEKINYCFRALNSFETIEMLFGVESIVLYRRLKEIVVFLKFNLAIAENIDIDNDITIDENDINPSSFSDLSNSMKKELKI